MQIPTKILWHYIKVKVKCFCNLALTPSILKKRPNPKPKGENKAILSVGEKRRKRERKKERERKRSLFKKERESGIGSLYGLESLKFSRVLLLLSKTPFLFLLSFFFPSKISFLPPNHNPKKILQIQEKERKKTKKFKTNNNNKTKETNKCPKQI